MAPCAGAGGLVDRGTTLVTIDPADYANALAVRAAKELGAGKP